ncbi:metallophosphoesterase [Halorubrum amylolyticum]|uniref:metallophosphoesterase n=1 Tax=Halorubrum amylolyticum TaxID=2508724 RepID=UPI001008FC69|nr:metallophosphoesterase [Halorubrum amylolyticum]
MGSGASPAVEPVVDEPAAVADLGSERALLVADVHAGIEVGLRYERGVELDSRADERRERLCALIAETDADRLVVLGDLAHRIAAPDGDEREELETLIRAVTDRVPMTLVEGNHDGGVAEAFVDDLDVIGAGGGVLGGNVGVLHGHTWPNPELLDADVICMGHEHPQVRLEDAVGGSRVERAWLRGALDPGAFVEEDGGERDRSDPPELVVFPAFNERSGGTWVNVDGQSFLAPFLPEALPSGDAYLLDGTRLGDYRRV